MKKMLIIFIFFSLSSKAQLDTLVYFGFWHPRNIVDKSINGYDTLEAMLNNKSCHYICVDFTYLFLQSRNKRSKNGVWIRSNSKETRKINKLKNKLESKLNEVKVFYIVNPTYQVLDGDMLGDLQIDTIVNQKLRLINNIKIEKFTNLNSFYIHGNDSDPIIKLPTEFYELPVKNVYLNWLSYPDVLIKSIKAKRPDIEVVVED
jgi:hypothetical protein